MLKYFSSRSEFSKNILTLISGTAVSQLIVIGLSPVLSRLYTPAEFGMLGTYMSIVSAIVIFSGGRYELAIVLPEEDKEAINLLALSFCINIGISFLSFLFSMLFIFFWSESLGLSPDFIFWLHFFPVFVFFIGSYQILSNWASRKKNYKTISAYRITNSLATVSANTGLGILKTGSVGLFVGNLIGNIFSAFVLWRGLLKDMKLLKGFISRKSIVEVASRYRKFPLTNSFQAASDMLQVNGIIYFASYFFTQAIVGSFSYTIRVLQAPMNFVGGAIALVFYQKASSLKNENNDINKLTVTTMKRSALVAFPVLIILFLFGPDIFSFVFGTKWRDAGEYARILSPWFFLDFIRASVSQVVFITGHQRKLLLFSIISNVFLVVAMLYGGLIAKDIKEGFIVFTILQSLVSIYLLYWFSVISGQNKNQIFEA